MKITLNQLKAIVDHMETIGADILNLYIDSDEAGVARIDFDELTDKGVYLHTVLTLYND